MLFDFNWLPGWGAETVPVRSLKSWRCLSEGPGPHSGMGPLYGT